MSQRSEYESMSRGDLINELCARDRAASPEGERALRELTEQSRQLAAHNSKLRQARHRLELVKGYYLHLFEMAPVAYCVIDRASRIAEANVAAAELVWVQRDKLVGVHLSDLVQPAEQAALLDHIDRCLATRERTTTNVTVVVPHRGEMVVQVVSAPLLTDDGPRDHCRTVLTPVTHLEPEVLQAHAPALHHKQALEGATARTP